MRFIFLEKVVNKLSTFLAIFFISFAAVCQNHSEDTQYLNKLSESTLERSVNFSWNGGNLSDALNKINAENSIKFSFSNSSIADIMISPCNYNDIKLFDLFSVIFKNTGFNYVLIGRIVAVYKDESNSRESSVLSDSTEVKITEQNEKLKPIYSSSYSTMLSRKDRIILNRIYRKELRWSARYHRQKKSIDSDTLNKREKNPPSYKQENLRYFVAIDLGLQKNYLKYKSNSQLNWKEDLDWNNRSENNILPTFLFGISIKGFMFGTGLRIQKVTIQNSFRDLKKGPSKTPPSSPSPFESTNVFVTERYSFFSIPVSFMYSKFRKNLWGGIGGGVCFNFISGNESMKNKLKKYYNDSTGTKDYSDNFKNLTTSLFADISIGYKLKNNIVLTGGLTYMHSLNPIYENSLFKLNINSMVYRVGLYYRFNIYGKR
ncbi:hypothetical protein MYP_3918 [Sporocytophaga myxococcoides]|uniref:Outer membrane protein beta-barrel domain-containing protein n=1 Tax=Sporocytophaga myxococcoides TaxID=153721 RepID=A0A098LKI8_9BACT|nr:hypothetical protein [Sporocytophaga myxococcoides]GAL86688.1 hypothetical protein MYP_3918 [Sporocytophaga myxococcoides]